MLSKKSFNKKTILLLCVSILLVPRLAHANNHLSIDISNCEARTFTTTAYYSPIDGQFAYGKGDIYREKILNGKGTHGASGRAVFIGMVAAPSSYPFGAKIITQDGIYDVQDRGGAIVHQGERALATHDRIDIRLGKGNSGLIRAISHGVQTMEGYYCPPGTVNIPDHAVGFDLDQITVPQGFFEATALSLALEPGMKNAFVYNLQKHLLRLGYFPSNRHTGYFGTITKQSICRFQLAHGVVSSGSKRCGVYGPKTRATLRNVLKARGHLAAKIRQPTNIDNLIDYGYQLQAIIDAKNPSL